ncbi:hypothetical protein ACFWPX_00995 [Nocardia sp. NPDC058518]|uniref:hypothetical protein n=1 Tax=Nocardia sp. NPDC058518 TaxID=3346534 RepID=UPI0036666B8D
MIGTAPVRIGVVDYAFGPTCRRATIAAHIVSPRKGSEMLATDTEDAVVAASADTEEEDVFESAKIGNGAEEAGMRAIGRTNITSIFWAQKILRTHGTGAWVFGFPSADVRADSQVSVSLTEIDTDNTPFLGPATTQVLNVVPHADGTMTVRYHVGWSSNIRVLFNFIIAN